MLLATFTATLTLGIELGIAVGVSLSLGMVIYRAANPHVASLGQVPNTNYYRNVDRFSHLIQREDVLVMRFDAPLFFANSGFFQDKLEELRNRKGEKLKLVVLNAEAISTLDSSAVHMLRDLIKEYRAAGIDIFLASAIGPVRDMLHKSGLIEEIGADHLFVNVHDAITHFDKRDKDYNWSQVAIQTNELSTSGSRLWD